MLPFALMISQLLFAPVVRRFVPALLLIALSVTVVHAQSWSPSETQKNALLSHISSYFSALDRENYSDVYDLLAPSLKAQATLSDFSAARAQITETVGSVTSRKLVRVSWYPGRGGVGTGLAVAVDYLAETDKELTVCGYLAWLEIAEGQYVMLRDDSSSFTRERIESGLKGLSEEQQRMMLHPPVCRSLFNPS